MKSIWSREGEDVDTDHSRDLKGTMPSLESNRCIGLARESGDKDTQGMKTPCSVPFARLRIEIVRSTNQ